MSSRGSGARILARFFSLMVFAIFGALLLFRGVLLNQVDDRIDAELTQEVEELRQLVGGTLPDGSCVTDIAGDGTCDVGLNPETGERFGNDVRALFDTFLRRNRPSEHETMLTFVDGRPFKLPFVGAPGPRCSTIGGSRGSPPSVTNPQPASTSWRTSAPCAMSPCRS